MQHNTGGIREEMQILEVDLKYRRVPANPGDLDSMAEVLLVMMTILTQKRRHDEFTEFSIRGVGLYRVHIFNCVYPLLS